MCASDGDYDGNDDNDNGVNYYGDDVRGNYNGVHFGDYDCDDYGEDDDNGDDCDVVCGDIDDFADDNGDESGNSDDSGGLSRLSDSYLSSHLVVPT